MLFLCKKSASLRWKCGKKGALVILIRGFLVFFTLSLSVNWDALYTFLSEFVQHTYNSSLFKIKRWNVLARFRGNVFMLETQFGMHKKCFIWKFTQKMFTWVGLNRETCFVNLPKKMLCCKGFFSKENKDSFPRWRNNKRVGKGFAFANVLIKFTKNYLWMKCNLWCSLFV